MGTYIAFDTTLNSTSSCYASLFPLSYFKHHSVSADLVQSYHFLTDNISEVLVEGQIASLHLNVSVTWLGKSLEATVLDNGANGKPLLFYASDPDPLTTSDKFRRITFPDCR